MKLPSGKTIGYGLLATAAPIVVGLILNAYFGPGQNNDRDIFWLQRAIGCAAFGGALVLRSQSKANSQAPEGQSPDRPELN